VLSGIFQVNKMEKKFENRVALITGGTFGIGKATAELLVKQGAKVVIADWLEDQEMIDNLKKSGAEISFIKCDVSRTEQVKNLMDSTIIKYGRIDFAFNNAGIEGLSDITHECTEENWDRTLSINLKGVWLCMKHELPHMLKAGKGSIVNTASVAGLIGFEGLPAYTASKHGILGLTKTAALEYAKKGIRINSVCPVSWLFSDDASFVTGHALSVDGGWSAQ
jgi:NAD(P)-dependent dehydrogenase (short-subunit alcohol dehydrogenase family)